MKLKVIASGSKGNCYLLENESECLIIEAGVNIKEVKKALKFSLKKVVGCIVTHLHGDHASNVAKMGNEICRVYAPADVLEKNPILNSRAVKHKQTFRLGGFKIASLQVPHDASLTCLSYIIEHEDMGKVVFATDLIDYCEYDEVSKLSTRYKISNLTGIMIEANYTNEIIDENVMNGAIDRARAERTKNSHCELSTAIDIIKRQNLSKMRNVVLLHLSNENADGEAFKDEVERQTGIPTTIARAGIEVELGRVF